MIDIQTALYNILHSRYGREVRQSLHDGLSKVNDNSVEALQNARGIDCGTAVTSSSSSSTGYSVGNLYLNKNTFELWKCTGTNTWQSQGIIKGAKGDTGANGTNGTNGVDGVDGADGNKWFRGNAVSSGSLTNVSVVANVNDNYLNTSEGKVYHCTSSTATTSNWQYDMTLTGGGTGGVSSYEELENLPSMNGHTIQGTQTSSDLGLADASHTHAASSITGLSSVATSGSYNDLTNKPSLKTVATSGSYNDLTNKPSLGDLTADSTHRTVTDTEKEDWNNSSKSTWFGNGGTITEVGEQEFSEVVLKDRSYDLYANTQDGSTVEIISTRKESRNMSYDVHYWTIKTTSSQVPVQLKVREVN